MNVTKVSARMILDSRGNPTVEADVVHKGVLGRASVPSGASTGEREAKELRDQGKAFNGKGVTKAIKNIEDVVAPKLAGKQFSNQQAFDTFLCELDHSEDKSNLGSNAILALSLAFAKANAEIAHQSLYQYAATLIGNAHPTMPTPMFNVLNGGQHAKDSADFQEYMIVPTGITPYEEQLRAGSEVFHSLGTILAERGYSTSVGDEGGYILPHGKKNKDGFELLVEAIERTGYASGQELFIAIDVAASELFSKGRYVLKADRKKLKPAKLIATYKKLVNAFPICSIEDGLEQNDWLGWAQLNQQLGKQIMVVGDDLLTTNPNYIRRAIDEKSCNAALIKPNQIGTLSETAAAVKLAHENKMTTIMSHRSGETEDTTIAHLAVGFGCKFIKAGSLSRSERLAKYNELLRISEVIG